MNNLWIGRFPGLFDPPEVRHGFSTRRGGMSRPPFDSLNVGMWTEDSPDCASANLSLLCNALGIPEDCLAIPHQVHGDRIQVVEKPGLVEATDALITSSPEVVLTVQVADCMPVFLCDPRSGTVGLVHAGWKGTAAEIARKTVVRMQAEMGTDVSGVSAFLGPSIGPCCCQVGPDVAGQFSREYISGGFLDLWACNRDQLLSAGLKPESIHESRLCTVCHSDLFFSHRASGGRTGRMMAFLGKGKKEKP
jgi:YfiH family protein